MIPNITERKKIINQLQDLAKNVRDLKSYHRQKRPIVIEFSGSPKAGKTSCINSLELFLKRNGFTVQIIQERASVCPVSDKQSPMFNFWTACMSLAGLIGTLENKKNTIDVLILDRGIFDSLCWFEWLVKTSKMETSHRDAAEQFFLLDEFVKSIDIVFAFTVDPKTSIEREYANLLTDKKGTIMNIKVLGEYLAAIHHTIDARQQYFHKVFEIDTSSKSQDEVGKEVTELTLNTLKDLLMERIGYFQKTERIINLFNKNSIIPFPDVENEIPPLAFDFRDTVENNDEFIQPIPIAVILNKNRNKLLVIKKSKSAVSQDSPEKDKELIYVGGHSRYEDKTASNINDFLSVCKTTLKREIKEEIGISIALNGIEPYCIYVPSAYNSYRHMAICFIIQVDEDSTKLRLDSQELVQNKGTSKSGKFVELNEIANSPLLEDWSKSILKYSFKIDVENNEQLRLFLK